jgi:hypothetical protein
LVSKLDLNEIHEEIYSVEVDASIKEHPGLLEEIDPEIISESQKIIQLQFLCRSDAIQNLISKLNSVGIQIHRLRSRSILEDYYNRYV